MKGEIDRFGYDIVEGQDGRIAPRYWMTLGDTRIDLLPHRPSDPRPERRLQKLKFVSTSSAKCRNCAAEVSKPFGGGFCYDCFSTLARCDLCVVSPDRCHHHLGTCREPDWGDQFCMQPHVVYVANSSGPKVGITRAGRIRERWVDQGASQGLVIASVPTRRAAGCVEAALRRWVADTTDWRRLVRGLHKGVDLLSLRKQLRGQLSNLADVPGEALTSAERAQMHWVEEDVLEIEYPRDLWSPAEILFNPASGGAERTIVLRGIVGGYLLAVDGVVAMSALTQGGVECEVLEVAAADLELEPADSQDPQGQMSLF